MMQTDGPATVLDAEDAKLVTLARGARGRAAAVEGAAVRDEDGSRDVAAPTTAAASSARAPEETAAATAACSAVNRSEGSSTVAAA